jgi:hypothetical protein
MLRNLIHIVFIGALICITIMVFLSGVCDVQQDREAWMAKHPRWRMELFVLENEVGK